MLITTNVEKLYPSNPNELVLKALEEALEKKESEQSSILCFKTITLNFKEKFITRFGTKFSIPYACIFMDQVEFEILKAQLHHSISAV